MWTWHVSMNCKDYFDVWKYIDVCLEEYKWLIPHAWIRRIQKRAALEKGKGWKGKTIPFSAFWLRSSVVSVLISLISDTWFIEPHDIKCIFLGGGPTHNSLLLGLSGVACALHYSTSLAHPNNTTQNDDDDWTLFVLVILNVCISFDGVLFTRLPFVMQDLYQASICDGGAINWKGTRQNSTRIY